ncbi:MAG: tryptophan--tRNA ligase [Patescibacteria group bacterium]
MAEKKVLVSGVKPTGRPHIGNYFGAMKQFVELGNLYESHVFIADLHAITSLQNGKELSQNSFEVLLDYLAIGLDPKKIAIYKQSDVPQVTELTWIFNCLITMPYLARAHAFKAALGDLTDATPSQRLLVKKLEQLPEINVGVFEYPLLMAADILIQGADVVPVGADQKQHVEIARDVALKFNNTFGETFKLPEALIVDNVATVPGTDSRKMSKSYGNTIELFATDEEIERAVMGIVTDSAGETPENVFKIHQLLRSKEELDKLYDANKGKYKVLKEALAEDLKKFIKPMREKRMALSKDRKQALSILESGGRQARLRAEKKMEEVRKKVGLTLS